MIDIHCHILPRVDDGARHIDESQAMLQTAKALGVTRLIATPHVKRRNPDFERIQAAFLLVREMAGFLGMQVFLGYELNLKAIDPGEIGALRRYCIEGTNALLLEMPDDNWPRNWENVLYALQREGYDLIVAHPERYRPLQRDFERVQAMVDLGCKLQVTGKSMIGWALTPEKALARRMIEHKLISYVASDAHSPGDYQAYGKALRKLMHMPLMRTHLVEMESDVVEQRCVN